MNESELYQLAETHFDSIPAFGNREEFELNAQRIEIHQCPLDECDDLMLFILSSIRYLDSLDIQHCQEFAEELGRFLPYCEVADVEKVKIDVDGLFRDYDKRVHREHPARIRNPFLELESVKKVYLLAMDWNIRSYVIQSCSRFVHAMWSTSE